MNMTLENLSNLEKIGQLKSHVTSREEVQRLLDAARRNLSDSDVELISSETRFDSAYKAVMQLALAAMMANGFRPETSMEQCILEARELLRDAEAWLKEQRPELV